MSDRKLIAIDSARDEDAQLVTARRDEHGNLHLEAPSREEIAETVRGMTEAFRPVIEAMRTAAEAACATLRPLAEHLAELHRQYPGPADWVIEPEPEGCHHLCGRDHECLGEASTTFAHPGGDGRGIPMCAPCRDCSVDAYVREGVVTRAEFLELMGAPERADRAPEFDGIIASLEGSAYPPVQVPQPIDDESLVASLNWGQPLTARDADWPADSSRVCAHVCGGGHECDVRATASLTYELPSGGKRTMPLCTPCHAAETTETANA